LHTGRVGCGGDMLEPLLVPWKGKEPEVSSIHLELLVRSWLVPLTVAGIHQRSQVCNWCGWHRLFCQWPEPESGRMVHGLCCAEVSGASQGEAGVQVKHMEHSVKDNLHPKKRCGWRLSRSQSWKGVDWDEVQGLQDVSFAFLGLQEREVSRMSSLGSRMCSFKRLPCVWRGSEVDSTLRE